MNPFITIAQRAARKAGQIIVKGFERRDNLKIATKEANDFVTDIDQQAERAIVEILSQAYPDHGILAEEGSEKSGNDYLWIIDPLDGTTNFIRGIPHFAVSIALQHKGRIEHGVVFDPIKNDLFYSSRGAGCVFNDKRCRASSLKNLDEALLATGLRHNEHTQRRVLAALNKVLPECSDIRRSGSAALDLAYTAAGLYDGFWEFGLNIWDIAAGSLMVQESGAMISSTSGAPDHLDTGNVLAANVKLFKQLLPLVHNELS